MHSDNENYSQSVAGRGGNSVCIELRATYSFAFASKYVPLVIDLQCSFIDSHMPVRTAAEYRNYFAGSLDGFRINAASFPRHRDDFSHPIGLNGVYKELSSIDRIEDS